MLTNEILKNPLVKIGAIAVILYLALFSDKKNPDSLRNRLSKDKIEKNLHEAGSKSKFIITNVGAAKKVAAENTKMGDVIIECGDEVITDYSIYNNDKKLYTEKNKKFTIGSKIDTVIEKNIMGMKIGETKKINIMDVMNTNQATGPSLPKLKSDVKYNITIVDINKKTSTLKVKLSCD
ncbi:MAG: hypothetical protein KGQ36_00370 [Rickettsiales bacterium]|nr:hypothetical protein [Rickettsiales bacterium]